MVTVTVPPMGRRLDIDQLVGAAEIADRLGVSNSQVVHVWRYRHPDFPQPVTTLKTAMIWYWPEPALILKPARYSTVIKARFRTPDTVVPQAARMAYTSSPVRTSTGYLLPLLAGIRPAL